MCQSMSKYLVTISPKKCICQHLYWWKQGLKIFLWEKSTVCILFAVCSYYVISTEFARKHVFIISLKILHS